MIVMGIAIRFDKTLEPKAVFMKVIKAKIKRALREMQVFLHLIEISAEIRIRAIHCTLSKICSLGKPRETIKLRKQRNLG